MLRPAGCGWGCCGTKPELEQARKSERAAPEISRLRAEVAALQQENSNLRRRITPEAGPAPRSPPPTEEPIRITLQRPPRGFFEETDYEIETPAHRIIPRRLNLTTTPDPIVVNWRSRGDHPAKKLSGFQFKADSPLYPDDGSKVNYALMQMEDPLFSAMQEWVIVQETCQLDGLLKEIELFMGIQFQEHDAEKALLTNYHPDGERKHHRVLSSN